MKKLLIAAAALFALAACNSNTEVGPEAKEPVTIDQIKQTPAQVVTENDEVTVMAVVACKYGLGAAQLAYDTGEHTQTHIVGAKSYAGETTTNFSAVIPKQEAGTTIRWQLQTISAYSYITYSEIYTYTVVEQLPDEPVVPDPEQ